MRFGELSGLRWRDVDFEQHTITLCRTKNGDRRIIPLSQEAERSFRSCRSFGAAPDTLVFQSTRLSKDDRAISIRGAFERALKSAGIECFRWHDLRHTAASYMAMSGATQGELMAILGHRSPSMTRRYAHFSQEHLRKLLERTENKLNTVKIDGVI
jgi:integrase